MQENWFITIMWWEFEVTKGKIFKEVKSRMSSFQWSFSSDCNKKFICFKNLCQKKKKKKN